MFVENNFAASIKINWVTKFKSKPNVMVKWNRLHSNLVYVGFGFKIQYVIQCRKLEHLWIFSVVLAYVDITLQRRRRRLLPRSFPFIIKNHPITQKYVSPLSLNLNASINTHIPLKVDSTLITSVKIQLKEVHNNILNCLGHFYLSYFPSTWLDLEFHLQGVIQ